MPDYKNISLMLRPQRFSEVVSHDVTKDILKGIIQDKRVPTGLILSGTRGVGKTTLSRLIAKSINCESLDSGEPCGVCDSCKMANDGLHPDIIEISGATNGNIDDIRKLIEQSLHTPVMGAKKVLIIDEAQGLGLSPASWNALLKVLEEPPAHLLWVFCTTELHKIPMTIKSRLVTFELNGIPAEDIKSYISQVISQQFAPRAKKDIDKIAEIVAVAANNSMRDALTLLEKVVAVCNKVKWDLATASSAVGIFDLTQRKQILDAIINHQDNSLWGVINKLIESGISSDYIFNEVLTKLVSDLMLSLLVSENIHKDILVAAQQIGKPRIIYLSDVLLKRTPQYVAATNKKFIFQLLSMELCA